MGGLFTTLLNSTGTLQVYQRAFNVIQNNISNVNTPGYSRQDLVILSRPFDPAAGLTGGILPGPMVSSRSEFLDQTVRVQQEQAGYSSQRASDLRQIEPLFDIGSEHGIPAALNKFFNIFSQLAVNPNDAVARQSVLDLSGDVAQSFQQTALSVQNVAAGVRNQTVDAVRSVNRLASEIAGINQQYRSSAEATGDAGLAARLTTALEELSEVANYTVIRTGDGAANVYLGGQVPLVVGDHEFAIQADLSGTSTVILDSQGNDVTALITRGKLGALLEEKNVTLPAYLAELNTLAKGFADTVNAQLALGVDRNGAVPTVGLFAYSSANDAASTLALTAITADQIAAALPAAPGGNGNAIAIARLADAISIGNYTFTQHFGNLGGRVGRDVNAAELNQERYRDAVTLARSRRQAPTGVSLDEEAAKLLQFQQAYQAVGKLVGVLKELTDTVMNMIR
jgi:flagellar hook-associated protein 1